MSTTSPKANLRELQRQPTLLRCNSLGHRGEHLGFGRVNTAKSLKGMKRSSSFRSKRSSKELKPDGWAAAGHLGHGCAYAELGSTALKLHDGKHMLVWTEPFEELPPGRCVLYAWPVVLPLAEADKSVAPRGPLRGPLNSPFRVKPHVAKGRELELLTSMLLALQVSDGWASRPTPIVAPLATDSMTDWSHSAPIATGWIWLPLASAHGDALRLLQTAEPDAMYERDHSGAQVSAAMSAAHLPPTRYHLAVSRIPAESAHALVRAQPAHALLVANTDAALETARRLYHADPPLLAEVEFDCT